MSALKGKRERGRISLSFLLLFQLTMRGRDFNSSSTTSDSKTQAEGITKERDQEKKERRRKKRRMKEEERRRRRGMKKKKEERRKKE